jgi:hypothetical protein
MEPVWNGMLTCDYEHTRPDSTLLEWDLYTRSLITWPSVLMDEPTPYGRLRRPGIVDIPEEDHQRLLTQWFTHLADPHRARDLVNRATNRQRQTADALRAAERALTGGKASRATAALAKATSAFLAVMSTHIVNWLLPEKRWEELLTRLFASRNSALECMFALTTPSEMGHLLNAHRHLLQAASAVRDGEDLHEAAGDFSALTGTFYGSSSPAAAPTPLEDVEQSAELLRTTSQRTDPDSQLATLAEAGGRTAALREAWTLSALLAASSDDQVLAEVRALITITCWAANSEERRKELRHRYLAAVRRWCELTGADPTRITTADLCPTGGTS